MTSLYQRTKMALQVGYNVFTNPEAFLSKLSKDERGTMYTQAYAYYRWTQFSKSAVGADYWTAYLNQRGLYKHTRLIYNPVPSVVDFYVDGIWNASSTAFTSTDDDARQLVTPLANGTDDKLIAAIAQLDQWTNWLSEQHKVKRYCAATGNVLIEVDDDLEREKILQNTVWAGFVTDLELNSSGDVLSYVIEYKSYDRALKEEYQYRREVDREFLRTYRDDRLTKEIEHGYGFCPAVWIRHTDDGGDYGIAAFHNLEKLDNLNSLASHLDDNIHKEIESGKIIGVDEPKTITVLSGGTKNADGSINETDPRLDRVLLAAKGKVSVNDLSGLLKLAEAHPYLRDQLESFADDYPELQAASIIKENSQLSGAALERMLTPAQSRLDRAAANYNQQLIKLRQMQIAIAGWRIRNGWLNNTPQQAMFAPFDLLSYEKGQLDFSLKRSLLVEPTEMDAEDLLTKKAARAVVLMPLVGRAEALTVANYSEEKVLELMAVEVAPTTPPITEPNDDEGN